MTTLSNRRQFLQLSTLGSAGIIITGCATNPITGKRQFIIMSESQELSIDKKQSPRQFSADYGKFQDAQLCSYVDSVGQNLARNTHRRNLPYSFTPLNASYINAYTFPGGTVGITRGIFSMMQSESELAALLGHELGHVNHRHTAQRFSQGAVAQLLVLGATTYAKENSKAAGAVTAGLGNFVTGLTLAKYSRSNEREADEMGMHYMTASGYDPKGMIMLMDILRNKSKHQPGLLQQLFASHPMSSERYGTAQKQAYGKYAAYLGTNIGKERYMDNIKAIRLQKPLIELIQKGDAAVSGKSLKEADLLYKSALRQKGDDYEALLKIARLKLLSNQYAEARQYAKLAKEAYPNEPQADYIAGLANQQSKKYDQAAYNFANYDKLMPGNVQVNFMAGYCYDKANKRQSATNHFVKYLNNVGVDSEDNYAKYAKARLQKWGVIKGQ